VRLRIGSMSDASSVGASTSKLVSSDNAVRPRFFIVAAALLELGLLRELELVAPFVDEIELDMAFLASVEDDPVVFFPRARFPAGGSSESGGVGGAVMVIPRSSSEASMREASMEALGCCLRGGISSNCAAQ
jgi:hypothetical protein